MVLFPGKPQSNVGGMKKVATNIYASIDAGAIFNGTTSLQTTAGVEYQHGNMAFRGAAGINRHGEASNWINAGLFQFGVRVNF